MRMSKRAALVVAGIAIAISSGLAAAADEKKAADAPTSGRGSLKDGSQYEKTMQQAGMSGMSGMSGDRSMVADKPAAKKKKPKKKKADAKPSGQ